MPLFRHPERNPRQHLKVIAVVTLAILLSLATTACDLISPPGDSDDSATAPSELSWPRYSFDELVARSDHILIAIILEKGRPIPTRLLPQPFTHSIACHVSVVEVLRESEALFADTLNSEYVEAVIGSEQETRERLPDLPPYVEIGQGYLLFLDENNLALSPDAVIPIPEGLVQLPDRLREAADTGRVLREDEIVRRIRDSLERAGLPTFSRYQRPPRSTETVSEEYGIPGESSPGESTAAADDGG